MGLLQRAGVRCCKGTTMPTSSGEFVFRSSSGEAGTKNACGKGSDQQGTVKLVSDVAAPVKT